MLGITYLVEVIIVVDHWLPSPERIGFMLAVLIYSCAHLLIPAWSGATVSLSDYILHVADSNRRHLWLSSSSQLVIRRTWLSTVGDRAFPVAGSQLWNSLPRDITSAPTLTVFLELPENLPNISFLAVFGLVLYTMYSSGLAVLYLSHSK